MNIFVLALLIGFVAGLRSMTAPALVSWAAHLGWIHLQGSPLAFMGSTVAVALWTLAALGEYVADKLPNTPARTSPPGLIARLVTGALSGACLTLSHGSTLLAGTALGVIGAVIGTFAGYQLRTGLVRSLNVKDVFIAIPEDLIAIGIAYFAVSAH
jgi:uncharacterized membrane protein